MLPLKLGNLGKRAAGLSLWKQIVRLLCPSLHSVSVRPTSFTSQRRNRIKGDCRRIFWNLKQILIKYGNSEKS